MEEMRHHHVESKEGEKGLNFDKDRATLLLDITPDGSSLASLRKIAEEEGLSQKDEFHITIIGSQTGKAIREKMLSMSSVEQDDFLSRIENLSNSFTWTYSFTPEYKLISKTYGGENGIPAESRRSIIQTLELPDLNRFYKKLNELLGTEFSVPFPHVTLFTTSTNEATRLQGIGVYSEEQLKTLNPVKITV